MTSIAYNVPPLEQIGTIAIRRFGSGKPLVLLHGGVGSWNHWTANIGALARKFTVIAVDLPGYGDSGPARADDPKGYIGDVAAALIQVVGASAAFDLAGFSFGSVIAASIAHRFSSQVRRLSLLGPGGFGVPTGRKVTLVPVPDRTIDMQGHRNAVAINLGEFMLSHPPSSNDPVVDLQSANIAQMRFDSRKISYKAFILEELAGIPCPLQIIWGASDRAAHPSVTVRAEQCSAVRPDAQIHVIPNAAHWVQYEAADAVNALLSEFHMRDDV